MLQPSFSFDHKDKVVAEYPRDLFGSNISAQQQQVQKGKKRTCMWVCIFQKKGVLFISASPQIVFSMNDLFCVRILYPVLDHVSNKGHKRLASMKDLYMKWSELVSYE